jgi:hypothetical protein
MEDLFRLVLMRPAVAQDKKHPSVDLTQDSQYQGGLRAALSAGSDPRAAATTQSRAFVASDRFLGEPSANPFADALEKLAERLDGLTAVDAAAVRKAAETAFGTTIDATATNDQFTDTMRRLRDSIVAIKVLQEEHARPLEELVGQLRHMELVARMHREAAFPADADALRIARFRTLRLPDEVGLGSTLSTRKITDDRMAKAKEARDRHEAEVNRLLGHHAALRNALANLGTINAAHLVTTPPTTADPVSPPDNLRRDTQAGFLGRMRDLQVRYAERGLETQSGDEVSALGSAPLTQALLAGGLPQSGWPGFKPQTAVFRLGPEGAKALSADTQRVLNERGMDLREWPLDRAAERLQTELADVVGQLEQVAGHPTTTVLKKVGDALIAVNTPVTTGWGAVGTGGMIAPKYVQADGRVPHTRGNVRSSGIADLIVVRQQLTGYEATDIADIESVLKGENKSREHTRRTETVLTTFTETEVTTDKETDHQASDRFEISRESSETIKEDVALKAGAKVSGKYGPVVEFAVSAEGSYQRTKEEATKTAAKFAHDVTDRSALKVATRVLERTTTTTTTDITERNLHKLDNTKGGGNVSGVYQWVNKVYQAQMYNYGLRAMFDFMVPEPAAFIIAAMNAAHASAMTLDKPPEFTLLPSQIDESNYGYWTHLYRATDVAPPPEMYKTASFDFKAGGGDEHTNYNHSGQITLDEGYRAIWGSVGAVYNSWPLTCFMDVILGQQALYFPNGTELVSTAMADEQGSVPVALNTWNVAAVALAIEVKCQRTDRSMDKWRLETHGKLMTAYQARLSEYNEALAQLEASAGSAIQGRNPAANRFTIEDELKKNCISILTDQHYDLFDAIDTSPGSKLPQIDIFEAAGEGPYVRFFEQAFEWEHMSWVTYPYFWGRKDQWGERIAYEDPDPAFNDFLRAGYARVTAPARPGFESAIDHFLTFGEIWNGGPLPAISSPLYLPVADELAEQLGRPTTEVAQGAPWPVRVPTTLVHLRPDDRLPEWEQDAQGNWVEKP